MTNNLNNLKISLHGEYLLSIKGKNVNLMASVPGSIYQALLENQIIPDPFDQDNEYLVREWMRLDYSYDHYFDFDKSYLGNKNTLVFEGIDTLSEIYLNKKLILKTDNMHITYQVDISDVLREKNNHLHIEILSPIEYIEKENLNYDKSLYHASESMRGYIHLRKAHYMFGWDWGPQLPDGGIFRDVYIKSVPEVEIQEINVLQNHLENSVELTIEINYVDHFECLNDYSIDLKLIDPQEQVVFEKSSLATNKSIIIRIENPKLWQVYGYGESNLYKLSLCLKKENSLVQQFNQRIGLRTVKLEQIDDEYGQSFTFIINGIKVFAKGANYIPEDNLLGRTSYELTRSLLEKAINANHNMIRVWGGGIYPPDFFYDVCDELGILVWQDLMFACSIYPMDKSSFKDNIIKEVQSNLKRIRLHPSLALICGNNENETAIEQWNISELEFSKQSFIKQYVEVLPEVVKNITTEIPYWRSSPASKELFVNSNSDKYGDMHYWGVWHNLEPISYYRKYTPRFMSEFGLQSFPSLETINTFARTEDLNIFSYVMEQHQKNKTANSKILDYIGKMFKYPKNFESLLSVSQLIQAEGIRYGVEHWRRNYGVCMGILYWQLNDCWPVASWSSIDYYGRLKALYYHSKKFYDDLLVSIEEKKNQAKVYLTNDLLVDVSGELKYSFVDFTGNVLFEESRLVTIDKQSSKRFYDLKFDLTQNDFMDKVLYVSFKTETKIYENYVSFVPDKYLKLQKPNFKSALIDNDGLFALEISTDTFVKYLEVKVLGEDIVFSDNFFNLLANQKRTITFNSKLKRNEVLNKLKINCLYDTYQ